MVSTKGRMVGSGGVKSIDDVYRGKKKEKRRKERKERKEKKGKKRKERKKGRESN